jgi:hypothetical protein
MMTLSNEWTLAHDDTANLALRVPAAVSDTAALEVARLRSADVILIETRSSVYTFTLFDPAMRQGWLSGGLLETKAVIVKWSGTVIKNAPGEQLDRKLLLCGGRAIFHIVHGSFPNNFLVTSTILRLSLQRAQP